MSFVLKEFKSTSDVSFHGNELSIGTAADITEKNIPAFKGCISSPDGKCNPTPLDGKWADTASSGTDEVEDILTIRSYFTCMWGRAELAFITTGQDSFYNDIKLEGAAVIVTGAKYSCADALGGTSLKEFLKKEAWIGSDEAFDKYWETITDPAKQAEAEAQLEADFDDSFE